MIVIIDYGAGNLKSVKNALDFLGADSLISDSEEDIRKAEKIILPGVGNFGDIMTSLKSKGLIEVLKEEIRKKPYLGICAGLQILFEESEEAKGIKGLSIFDGMVKRFKKDVKVPQIGWNSIRILKKNKILDGIVQDSYFYFVHSYYVEPEDKGIILTKTDYGIEYVSGIAKGNIFAFQFHPEKSGDIGLRLLKNFLEIV